MTDESIDSELPPPGWVAEKTPFEISMAKHTPRAVLKSPVDHEFLYQFAGQLIESIKALKSRVKELEDAPKLEYLGVWAEAKTYGSGKFVTHDGSMWFAKRANVGERPGNSDSWQLAVKKGKTGK